MRLAFLADASLPHTRRWVNFFSTQGHDCLLLSLEPGEGYSCETEWLEPRAGLPRFLRYTLDIPAARARVHTFRPDLVNPHFLPNYGWMATRMGLHPCVLTVLGSDVLMVPKTSPLHQWRTRFVLSSCDFVTSDAEMLSKAVGRFGFPEDKVLTVPMGIETERFGASAEHTSAPPFVTLSTRRLEAVYDVATLVRAATRLAPDVAERFEFRIVGAGALESELRRQAASTPVQFLGWLATDALDAELVRAHLYVSTATSDSTSVSLLEAMAAGCFPVVTDIAGNREWVQDGVNGSLFPVGDDSALANCLQRAAADVDLRQRAAAHNRQIVRERASWERNMREVETLFARLCESN